MDLSPRHLHAGGTRLLLLGMLGLPSCDYSDDCSDSIHQYVGTYTYEGESHVVITDGSATITGPRVVVIYTAEDGTQWKVVYAVGEQI